MQTDYFTRLGLINDPEYKVLSHKYILGIKIRYNELLLIVNCLKLTSITFLVLILMFFIIRRIKKTERQRFRWTSFVLFSFLISLILLLHFIPSILEDMANFDMYARGYNRQLIEEGYITENLYSYYFDKKIEDINSFKNRIEDIVLWAIIGYISVLAIIYIKRENKLKKEIINFEKGVKLLDIAK